MDDSVAYGGEPLAQAPAVARLLARVRARTTLSVLVFSGYTLREILGALEAPQSSSLSTQERDERCPKANKQIGELV